MLLRGPAGRLQPLDVILKRFRFWGKRSWFLEDVSVVGVKGMDAEQLRDFAA